MSTVHRRDSTFRYVSVIDILSFVFLLLAIISGLAISHGDTSLSSYAVPSFLAKLSFFLTFFVIFLTVVIYKFKKITLIFLVPVIYGLLYYFDNYSGDTPSIAVILGLVCFSAMGEDVRKRTFELYKKYLYIMALLGIVFWIVYMLKIPIPYIKVNYYANLANDYYINYIVSYLETDGFMVRLCGLFNEPGYFGTIIGLLLCADGMNLKKKENIVLLIAGFMTLSAAFVAIIVLYLILESYKNKRLFVLLLILYSFVIFVLPNISFSNPVLDAFVHRFVWTGSGFLGDNRSSSYQTVFLGEMLKSKDVLWGMGTGYSQKFFRGSLSYKSYIINYGVCGSILLYGSLMLTALKECRKNLHMVFFVIVFMISVYQRPSVFNMVYFVILYGGIAQYVSNYATDELKR